MNERENFINNLERAINLAYGEGREFIKLTIGDVKRILQLLKEQEAVPVDTKMIGMPNGTDIEVYCCRDCRITLDPAFNYCPNCGQWVDWTADGLE